jgi:hypothetical protein
MNNELISEGVETVTLEMKRGIEVGNCYDSERNG